MEDFALQEVAAGLGAVDERREEDEQPGAHLAREPYIPWRIGGHANRFRLHVPRGAYFEASGAFPLWAYSSPYWEEGHPNQGECLRMLRPREVFGPVHAVRKSLAFVAVKVPMWYQTWGPDARCYYDFEWVHGLVWVNVTNVQEQQRYAKLIKDDVVADWIAQGWRHCYLRQ